MAKIVYGVFDNAAAAEAVREHVHDGQGHGDWRDAMVHEGHFREEDVQLAGTDAKVGALQGGAVVFVAGMVAIYAANALIAGLNFGLAETLLFGFASSVFGVVAGAVAGASEAKSGIREVGSHARPGEVVMTVETSRDGDAERIADLFETHGGHDIHAA